MNISIFGLGYVGTVSLACLARDGHRVVGVDIDPEKLALISAGRTPVVEQGMVELMRKAVKSERVSVTADVRRAVLDTDVSFVCVGTPAAPNGRQDQSAVVRLTHELARAMGEKNRSHLFVFRSTILPGTTEGVLKPILEAESGKCEGTEFHVCFQPEFLREGSSIRDYDNPPFTIIGARAEQSVAELRTLFGHLPCELHVTSIRTAEMVKYCCNNFHALKITFANETARLCEALGVDPFEVMDLMCRDTHLNISRAYMQPGFAFGGSCLPKDLRATTYLAKTHDVELPMLSSILPSNGLQLEKAISKILASGSRRIGLIGLSFKAGTDDLRESPLVSLAEHLMGKGLRLKVYDPHVQLSRLLGANLRYIQQTIPHIGLLMSDDLASVVDDADALVVGLNDSATLQAIKQYARPDQIVFDLVNMRNREGLHAKYVGLCW